MLNWEVNHYRNPYHNYVLTLTQTPTVTKAQTHSHPYSSPTLQWHVCSSTTFIGTRCHRDCHSLDEGVLSSWCHLQGSITNPPPFETEKVTWNNWGPLWGSWVTPDTDLIRTCWLPTRCTFDPVKFSLPGNCMSTHLVVVLRVLFAVYHHIVYPMKPVPVYGSLRIKTGNQYR